MVVTVKNASPRLKVLLKVGILVGICMILIAIGGVVSGEKSLSWGLVIAATGLVCSFTFLYGITKNRAFIIVAYLIFLLWLIRVLYNVLTLI